MFFDGIIFNQPELKNSGNILLIPIPLSKKRENRRGFNQAELIAKSFNINHGYKISLALKKVKDTKAQSSQSAPARAKNIKNCFVWAGDNLKGKTIILIDDVVTTGATLNEAAAILKIAGAEKIYGLVIAKG
jgi:ComF family protein